MLSFARRRLTFANVVLTLALVFAMTGGAFAAGKFLITSTKQISPKVLKSLQGKAGPAGTTGAAGAAGLAGPVGATGPQGPAGAAGAKGETGSEGKEGKEGKAGKDGKNGTTGFTDTLPEGKTEEGVWGTTMVEATDGSGGKGLVTVSFNIPLAAALPESHIQFNLEGFPAGATTQEQENCPGTPEEPKAKAGFLCLYTIKDETEVEKQVSPVVRALHSSTVAGAVFSFLFSENLGHVAYGSWAVTAE